MPAGVAFGRGHDRGDRPDVARREAARGEGVGRERADRAQVEDDGRAQDCNCAMSFSSLTASAAKVRMPSASFSVAIASSLSSNRKRDSS